MLRIEVNIFKGTNFAWRPSNCYGMVRAPAEWSSKDRATSRLGLLDRRKVYTLRPGAKGSLLGLVKLRQRENNGPWNEEKA